MEKAIDRGLIYQRMLLIGERFERTRGIKYRRKLLIGERFEQRQVRFDDYRSSDGSRGGVKSMEESAKVINKFPKVII